MIYKKFTFINNNKNLLFLKSLKHQLYPLNFSLKKTITFYYLILGIGLNIRAFRLVFNLPINGQNTWSYKNITNRHINNFIFYKFSFFKKIFKKTKYTFFQAEYINLFFQAYFPNDWFFNKKSLKKVLAIRKSKKFIDITALTKLHIYNFYRNKLVLKKKISKKKKKNPKKRNIGFSFGFTSKFKKHLI